MTKIELPRRRFLLQCLALAAAPAIVRALSLMPVRAASGIVTATPGMMSGWHIGPNGIWVGATDPRNSFFSINADGVMYLRGSIKNPCDTITEAMNVAQGGSTIFVMPRKQEEFAYNGI